MEPITPFSLRVRQLYEKAHISTILVAGSSGSYFYEADHIIQMKEYQPEDITEMAKAAAQEFAILENDNKSLENVDLPEAQAGRGREIRGVVEGIQKSG